MIEADDVGVITTDLLFLKKPCEKVETKEEGEEIAKKLFRTLTADATGVGQALRIRFGLGLHSHLASPGIG